MAKTAVSIPDPVFKAGEAAARRLGISRSELYARALSEYLTQEKAVLIRESYDRAFGEDASLEEERSFQKRAAQKLLEVEW
jgi:hypothetical protein